MVAIDCNVSVGQLVRERPARAKVFERLGIDYCCGGKLALADACRRRGLPVATVLEHVEWSDAHAECSSAAIDADSMSLTALADHIEKTHHAYLREELPRLDRLTDKVARVHGDKEPRLLQVRAAFVHLRAELEPHLLKEERILFPMVRDLEGGENRPQLHCGSVANPIKQMEHEHDDAGKALALIRHATDGFTPPDWACNTYFAMLDGLAKLEADMHEHVHKENNVLFPKAAELEAAQA